MQVRIETAPQREARIDLEGPSGLERSSVIDADVRFQQVEWKNILLTQDGEYEVWLFVSDGCTAHDRMIVGGAGR